jgi:hypothetical protein
LQAGHLCPELAIAARPGGGRRPGRGTAAAVVVGGARGASNASEASIAATLPSGEEFLDRGDRECTIQPAIEGGKVGARADAMLLVTGHRQTTSPQEHQEGRRFALGLTLGFTLRFTSIVGPAVRFAEELLDLGFHVQCLSGGFAQGLLDQDGV